MTQDADPHRTAALPVVLQAQLEEATSKLAKLERAGLLDLDAEQVAQLRLILVEDEKRRIERAYVRAKLRLYGLAVFGGVGALSLLKDDIANLAGFLRETFGGRGQ